MVNAFEKKFGKKDNLILAFGDWDQKQQMKYKAPTLGIGTRRIFRRHGFNVYLQDEYRTSCKCHECFHDCLNIENLKVKDPRPWKHNDGVKYRGVHGLLRCKNVNCKRFWNRDVNGSKNIRLKASRILYGLEEIPQLSRKTVQIV